jgi:hypothetical protein
VRTQRPSCTGAPPPPTPTTPCHAAAYLFNDWSNPLPPACREYTGVVPNVTAAAVPTARNIFCDGKPPSSDQCLAASGDPNVRFPLRVTASGRQWDPTSYASAVLAIATGLQIFAFAAAGPFADYGACEDQPWEWGGGGPPGNRCGCSSDGPPGPRGRVCQPLAPSYRSGWACETSRPRCATFAGHLRKQLLMGVSIAGALSVILAMGITAVRLGERAGAWGDVPTRPRLHPGAVDV